MLRPLYKNDDGKIVHQELGATQNPEPNEYVALLTQSGTAAPSVTVLKNTLGGTVVWTRNAAGVYYGTLTGVFTQDKTAASISYSGAAGANVSLGIGWATVDYVAIGTGVAGVLTDGQLNRSRVSIHVFY